MLNFDATVVLVEQDDGTTLAGLVCGGCGRVFDCLSCTSAGDLCDGCRSKHERGELFPPADDGPDPWEGVP